MSVFKYLSVLTQKKVTRCNYDSNSGHAYLIGCRTGNVIGTLVYSQKCTTCNDIATFNLPEDKEHSYPYNHCSGLNKEMEDSAALNMVVAIWFNSKNSIGVEYIVSDDDSTIYAHLHHPANNKIGRLPNDILKLSFLVDTSHIIKVICKEVFKLSLASNKSSDFELIDILWLKNTLDATSTRIDIYPQTNLLQNQWHRSSIFLIAMSGVILNGITIRKPRITLIM